MNKSVFIAVLIVQVYSGWALADQQMMQVSGTEDGTKIYWGLTGDQGEKPNKQLIDENFAELYARPLARGKAYVLTTSYSAGDVVTVGDKIYISQQDNNAGRAVTDTAWWTEVVTSGGTETDPIYTAWDKSYLDLINRPSIIDWTQAGQGTIHATNYVDNNTQLTDGDIAALGYIKTYTETDPVFSGHAAASVTTAKIADWDTAVTWGDHALAGYLTGYTETDPVYLAWDKDYFDLVNRPTTITTAQTTKLTGIEDGATTDQDTIYTIAGDTGSVSASSPITTINVVGASGVSTSVSGSTLIITVDAYVAGAMVRPGHAGGQIAYGGTGAGENCEIYSTTNATKGSIHIGGYLGNGVEINEATGETIITGSLTIK